MMTGHRPQVRVSGLRLPNGPCGSRWQREAATAGGVTAHASTGQIIRLPEYRQIP